MLEERPRRENRDAVAVRDCPPPFGLPPPAQSASSSAGPSAELDGSPMTKPKRLTRILVAEDIASIGLRIQRLLSERGHWIRYAENGRKALEKLRTERFDLVVSDWVMPEMDGIELIARARAEFGAATPPFVMQTAVDTDDAREAAMEVGADDYLAKPWEDAALVTAVENCLARRRAPLQRAVVETPTAAPVAAPFPCVCLTASTGGPVTMRRVLEALDPAMPAACVVVVHGPAWMLESLCKQLARTCPMPVELATDGVPLAPGRIFIAPGERHTIVDANERTLRVVDTPPENWVRPAADPLFRSAAAAFGAATIGVVMTGLGRDGSRGAAAIVAAGGRVIVQEPSTCVAAPMPESVIEAGVPCRVVPLDDIVMAIGAAVSPCPRRS